MNQYKKTALLWVLLLAICAVTLGGCINIEEGDVHIYPPTMSTVTSDVPPPTAPEETIPKESTPEETISEESTPEETTPEATTPEVTTPKTTTPEVTTPESTTPEETTPTETTPQETTTEESTTSPVPEEKIKIYIDQGHNPFSPTHPPSWNTGASNEELGLYEQDLTYEIGILLAELLAQDERFEIRLSRPTPETILGTDNDSALDFRINDAAEWEADYFISLHINAADVSSATGIEVYTATGDTEGYALGEEILGGLIESTELRNRGMKSGDKLRVVKNAKMPAMLVEMGFISNANDAKLLDESPELFAQGIYNGIQTYFNATAEETTTAEQA